MSENIPNDIPNEILQETRKLVNEMLKDPELAGKAISDRNIIIKSLKADIEHRKAAFTEIASRHDELSNKIDLLESNIKNFQHVDGENKKLREELEKEKTTSHKSFVVGMEKVINKIPGFWGTILKFLFTGPLAKYTRLAFFCILFIASITGWGFIAHALEPFAYLYKIMMGN